LIGLLGSLRFRVNRKQVLTFNNFKRDVSATWNTIDRIGMKPLTEFGGAQLQKVTLEITLDASLGVKPRKLISAIDNMIETGEVNELIIGKKVVGKNKWVITKTSQEWNVILRGGELYRATLNVSLQEYA
jgi:phage protein U